MQLAEICQTFKVIEQTDRNKEPEENNLFLREYLDKRPSMNNIVKKNDNMMQVDDVPKNQENRRWERFGGKAPFEYLKDSEEVNIFLY